MKSFINEAAQGEMVFVRVNEMPSDIIAEQPTNGEYLVGHSTSGHHHVMSSKDVKLFRSPATDTRPLFSYIVVEQPTEMLHRKDYQAHESLLFSPGMFEVRHQRERTPTGWRMAID